MGTVSDEVDVYQVEQTLRSTSFQIKVRPEQMVLNLLKSLKSRKAFSVASQSFLLAQSAFSFVAFCCESAALHLHDNCPNGAHC